MVGSIKELHLKAVAACEAKHREAAELIDRLYGNVRCGYVIGMSPKPYRRTLNNILNGLNDVIKDIDDILFLAHENDWENIVENELAELGKYMIKFKALRDDLVGFEYSFTEHWEPNMLARSRIHLCAVIFAGFVLFGFWLLKAIGYIA